MVESSKFPPSLLPVQVTAVLPTEDYNGGSLGLVRASDRDPHDRLSYEISSLSKLFKIDSETGALYATRSLQAGQYSLNVTVSDGKFDTAGTAEVVVHDVEDDMISSGLILVLGGATLDEFVLSYRRSFLRGISNSLQVSTESVVIISIQNSGSDVQGDDAHDQYMMKISPQLERSSEISILFCVRKSSGSYVPRKELYNKIISDVIVFESTLGLRVLRVANNLCHNVTCVNGRCQDFINLLDSPTVVSTDVMNFVAVHHVHKGVCICPTGYTGRLCDQVLNKCAFRPCSVYKECVPDETERGFSCRCPSGYVGSSCSKKISECKGEELTPRCYVPSSPISFEGRGFVQYNIRSSIAQKFRFSTWFRTSHPSGNILFIAGRIDYCSLEVGKSFLLVNLDVFR